MASSCPTIIRRSPVSSCVASLPVLAGSNGMLSRTMFSTAFRLGGTVCLGSPLHKLSGNPSAISIDAPRRANFHPAHQRPLGQFEEQMYYFGHVFGPDLPICTVNMATKSRGHASRH